MTWRTIHCETYRCNLANVCKCEREEREFDLRVRTGSRHMPQWVSDLIVGMQNVSVVTLETTCQSVTPFSDVGHIHERGRHKNNRLHQHVVSVKVFLQNA